MEKSIPSKKKDGKKGKLQNHNTSIHLSYPSPSTISEINSQNFMGSLFVMK